jgi:hypothetical protein
VVASFKATIIKEISITMEGTAATTEPCPSLANQKNWPRPPQDFNKSPEDILNGPCNMDYYIDSKGRWQSKHLMKNCQTFLKL